MQISLVSAGASAIYHPPAGYRWKLISCTASVTGTSTADSTVSFVLSRLNQPTNDLTLLTVTSTSTDTTVFGSLETAAAAASVLYSPIILASPDFLYVNVTNNSSVKWTITVEESPGEP